MTTIKRFLLFAVEDSRFNPGMLGLVSSFDTRVSAVNYAQRKVAHVDSIDFNSWHVFDCEERRIVAAESLMLRQSIDDQIEQKCREVISEKKKKTDKTV